MIGCMYCIVLYCTNYKHSSCCGRASVHVDKAKASWLRVRVVSKVEVQNMSPLEANGHMSVAAFGSAARHRLAFPKSAPSCNSPFTSLAIASRLSIRRGPCLVELRLGDAQGNVYERYVKQ